MARLDEARAERAAALAAEGSGDRARHRDRRRATGHRGRRRGPRARRARREIEAGALVAGGRPVAARHPRLFASVTRAITHCADCPVLVTHGDQTNAQASGPILPTMDPTRRGMRSPHPHRCSAAARRSSSTPGSRHRTCCSGTRSSRVPRQRCPRLAYRRMLRQGAARGTATSIQRRWSEFRRASSTRR